MQEEFSTPDHYQVIIPAFAGTGSATLPSIAPSPAFAGAGLRRIAPYASVVAPRRLASNILLAIRDAA
jgi:hypothetical protein